MKLLLLTFIIQQSLAFDLPSTGCCADVKINNDHFNVTDTYHTGDAFPTDAHYDVYGNLFYVESGKNDKGFYFDVKVIKFKTTAPEKITGLPEGTSYSVAIDKKNTKVYFGTRRGMFVYNYETHTAKPASESTLKLDMIFVDSDGNQYITESNNGVEELFLLDGKKKIRFHTLEALNELGIDDKNNFYYIKEERLYVLRNDLSSPVYIGNVTYDGLAQISFNKEHVFVASEDLIYFHEKDIGKLITVDNVPGKVTAVAFDNIGDFVIGIKGKILKYKKNVCYHRENMDENDNQNMDINDLHNMNVNDHHNMNVNDNYNMDENNNQNGDENDNQNMDVNDNLNMDKKPVVNETCL